MDNSEIFFVLFFNENISCDLTSELPQFGIPQKKSLITTILIKGHKTCFYEKRIDGRLSRNYPILSFLSGAL